MELRRRLARIKLDHTTDQTIHRNRIKRTRNPIGSYRKRQFTLNWIGLSKIPYHRHSLTVEQMCNVLVCSIPNA